MITSTSLKEASVKKSVVFFVFFFATFFGIGQHALASGVCQIQVSCRHLVACVHPVTTTTIVACQHYVTTQYGTTVAHPSGDIITNTVPMHPGGDFLHAFDLETVDCGY